MTTSLENIIRLLLIAILIVNTNIGFSQKYFSFGSKKSGLCFGSPEFYNGIKFNIFDKKQSEKINGINISCFSSVKFVNGISFSFLNSNDMINVISMSLISSSEYTKGLQISLFDFSAGFIGVKIGLFNQATKGIIGLQTGIVNWNGSHNMRCHCFGTVKGVQLGFINRTLDLRGLQIGIFNTTGGSGLQIGLINYRKNNKWYMKVLPIFNIQNKNKKTKKQRPTAHMPNSL